MEDEGKFAHIDEKIKEYYYNKGYHDGATAERGNLVVEMERRRAREAAIQVAGRLMQVYFPMRGASGPSLEFMLEKVKRASEELADYILLGEKGGSDTTG